MKKLDFDDKGTLFLTAGKSRKWRRKLISFLELVSAGDWRASFEFLSFRWKEGDSRNVLFLCKIRPETVGGLRPNNPKKLIVLRLIRAFRWLRYECEGRCSLLSRIIRLPRHFRLSSSCKRMYSSGHVKLEHVVSLLKYKQVFSFE